MKRILVADDEQDIRELLAEFLASRFEVILAENGRIALQLAMDSLPDLILLDVTMPEMEGTEVCRRLKAHPATKAIPVILLTARGELAERVRGLNLGADDYIPKPFYPEELVARIEARIRSVHVQESVASVTRAGNLSLDPVTREVSVAGKTSKLTALETGLLSYFLARLDKVVTRKELLGTLWPDAVVSDRTVDTHVANLRKKIAGFDYIFESVHGTGYRLRSR